MEFAEPSDLPTASGEGTEEPVKLAFCPLLLAYTGGERGSCDDVDCRRCRLLFDEYGRDVQWLCSNCAKERTVAPYWGDGYCDICGVESGILLLCP